MTEYILMKPKLLHVFKGWTNRIGQICLELERDGDKVKCLFVGGTEELVNIYDTCPAPAWLYIGVGTAYLQRSIENYNSELKYLSYRQAGAFGYASQQEHSDEDCTRMSVIRKYIAQEEYDIECVTCANWLIDAWKYIGGKEEQKAKEEFFAGAIIEKHFQPGEQKTLF